MEYMFKGNQECNRKVWGKKNPKTNQNPNPKASKEKAKNSNKKLNIVDLVLIYYN